MDPQQLIQRIPNNRPVLLVTEYSSSSLKFVPRLRCRFVIPRDDIPAMDITEQGLLDSGCTQTCLVLNMTTTELDNVANNNIEWSACTSSYGQGYFVQDVEVYLLSIAATIHRPRVSIVVLPNDSNLALNNETLLIGNRGLLQTVTTVIIFETSV